MNFYKDLIHLRKEDAQLRDGEFFLIDPNNQSVLSFLRKTADGKAVLVSINFSPDSQTVSPDLNSAGVQGKHLKTLLASFSDANMPDLGHIKLPAYGSYVAQIEP